MFKRNIFPFLSLIAIVALGAVFLMGASSSTVRGQSPTNVAVTLTTGGTEYCSTMTSETVAFVAHNRQGHDMKLAFATGGTNTSNYLTLVGGTYWGGDIFLKNGEVICFQSAASGDVAELVLLH
jgi:hypothetical protein